MHPSSFREALFETPERCPLATLPSQPVSPAITVHFAKTLAQAYSDRVIPETIRVLETSPVNPTPSRAAHHKEMKQQKRPEGQEDRLLSSQRDLMYNVGGAVNTLMQTGTACALVLLVNVTRPSLQYGKG